MKARRRALRLAALALVPWPIAALLNAGEFIMGGPPSGSGVVASIAAACAWPIAAALAGPRSRWSLVRTATGFWFAITAGAPAVGWLLNVSPGRTMSQGGWLLPLMLFALAAPLYGLYSLLPAWEPMTQLAVVGLACFAMTMAAHFAAHCLGGSRWNRTGGQPLESFDPESPEA